MSFLFWYLLCLLLHLSTIFAFRSTSPLLLLPLQQRSHSSFATPQPNLRSPATAAQTDARTSRTTGGAAEGIREVDNAVTSPPPPQPPAATATPAAIATPATAGAAAAAGSGSPFADIGMLEGLGASSPLSVLLQLYPRSCYSKTGTERMQPVAAAESPQQQTPNEAQASRSHASDVEAGAREVSIHSTAVRWLSVGRVGGAHGLRGHLEIFPSTSFEEKRFCCPSSRLFFGGGGVSALFVSRRVESGRILQRHRGKQVALVKLQGINDRAAAAALSGFRVYVHPMQSASLLPPHTVLAADLVGFDVQLANNPNKDIIGKVVDVVSKYDMRLKPEAVGAADDCLEIALYTDIPARRLLLEAYRDPAAPSSALLASALHALGPDQPQCMHQDEEEPLVLFECEGCGLRFRDCAAAVTHERLCLRAARPPNKFPAQCGSGPTPNTKEDEQDALQWLLQTAAAACDLPTQQHQQEQQEGKAQGKSNQVLGAEDGCQMPPSNVPQELLSLEGPQGRSGRRLGRQFYQRLSLGNLVSWDRGLRFFPRRGEAAAEAAERALNFACSSRSCGETSSYSEADWSDARDVISLSARLGVASDINPAACETDRKPQTSTFLLPYVLGVTVEEVKKEAKTVAINAPPGLLH